MPPGRPIDTSKRADQIQFDRFREMSMIEKAEILTALTQATEQLALAGLREQHPGASDRELRMRLAVRRLGAETVRRVWGWTDGSE